jgi:hypothetical protein
MFSNNAQIKQKLNSAKDSQEPDFFKLPTGIF